jgi:hypothetical protein
MWTEIMSLNDPADSPGRNFVTRCAKQFWKVCHPMR